MAFLILVLFNLLRLADLTPCTEIILQTRNNFILGRTFDFSVNPHPRIVNFKKDIQLFDKKEKYAIDYPFAAISLFNHKNIISEGINKKELCVSILWMEDASFAQKKDINNENTLFVLDLPLLLLGKCETVREVIAFLKNKTIWSEHISILNNDITEQIVPRIHLAVYDRFGEKIVIEFKKGKPRIFAHNGVITNQPSYPWHIEHLGLFTHLDNKTYHQPRTRHKSFYGGNGNGLFGLPGDYTSYSRFVRASILKKIADENIAKLPEAELISYMDKLLSSLIVPQFVKLQQSHDELRHTENDLTYYQILKDQKNKKWYIKKYNEINYTEHNIKKLLT